jgi:hypothetical protein
MIFNIVGFLGAGAIVLAYAMLQFGRLQAQQRLYSAMNAIGAALILISLAVEPNWPSIAIESFWLLISVVGLLRSATGTKTKP